MPREALGGSELVISAMEKVKDTQHTVALVEPGGRKREVKGGERNEGGKEGGREGGREGEREGWRVEEKERKVKC